MILNKKISQKSNFQGKNRQKISISIYNCQIIGGDFSWNRQKLTDLDGFGLFDSKMRFTVCFGGNHYVAGLDGKNIKK